MIGAAIPQRLNKTIVLMFISCCSFRLMVFVAANDA
jgi:hypothetical protein